MSHATSTVPSSDAAAPSNPRPRRRRWRRVIGWGILALLVGVPLVDVLSDPYGEVSDWYYAAGLENAVDDRTEQAEANFDAALRWSPKNYRVYVARAQMLAGQKQYAAALEQIDEAIALVGEKTDLLIVEATLHQRLDQHADAVASWKKIEENSRGPSAADRLFPGAYEQRRSSVLNAVAYAQAVGNLELDAALEAANESLELIPENAAAQRAMVLDTRGFVQYRRGEYEKALVDLNGAVDAYEKFMQRTTGDFEAEQRKSLDAKQFQVHVATQLEGLAVMLYHRALTLRALGDETRAEADLKRAREIIGREPDETLF